MHTPKYQIDTVSLHLSQLGSVLTQKDVLPKQLFDLSYAINSTLSSQEKIKNFVKCIIIHSARF